MATKGNLLQPRFSIRNPHLRAWIRSSYWGKAQEEPTGYRKGRAISHVLLCPTVKRRLSMTTTWSQTPCWSWPCCSWSKAETKRLSNSWKPPSKAWGLKSLGLPPHSGASPWLVAKEHRQQRERVLERALWQSRGQACVPGIQFSPGMGMQFPHICQWGLESQK